MNLIPKPKQMVSEEGEFVLTCHTYLVVGSECPRLIDRQAVLFGREAEKQLGYALIISRGRGQKGDIELHVDTMLAKEGYRIAISPEGIQIYGNDGGIWYGLQTLLQMIIEQGAVLKGVIVEDAPDIMARGFYYDCSRGRIPRLSWLKKLADRMAFYKLNQLQLYIEHTYLFRNLTELWRDDTPLTAAEIMELDRYCLERGIELIPSLSSFGHLYKLLSSKSYGHLCELEGSKEHPFSLMGRMHHHTIDTTNPESFTLIQGMIAEYMELFVSEKFNICADETFDLGSGRSRLAAEEKGRDRIYIDYVKRLAQFVVDRGKIPMFWGDIIAEFPEMIRELPEEMICLNWGYAPDLTEADAAAFAKADAVQYCCPGCHGWNHLIPSYRNAWRNIRRQCAYAIKYGAEGVLNTDWGDYMHINHPDFSVPGMIYGAVSSWNGRDAWDENRETYQKMNEQISRLEYQDPSGRLLSILDKAEELTAFTWDVACLFWELGIGVAENEKKHCERIASALTSMEYAAEKTEKLRSVQRKLYGHLAQIAVSHRDKLKPYLTAIEGIRLFNLLGMEVCRREYGYSFQKLSDCKALAAELEIWLYDYKQIYRAISRESELFRIEALVCWYGDYLRSPDFHVNKT